MLELLRNWTPVLWVVSALIVLPFQGTAAQELREVVSKRVIVGTDEGTLELEFDNDDMLSLSFLGGEILLDGLPVGEYERGDDLHAMWRELLGEITTLENGELTATLMRWDPPAALSGDAADVADLLDRTLENAFEAESDPAIAIDVDPSDIRISINASELLSTLLRTELVPALSEAFDDIEVEGLTFHVGDDVEVNEDVDGPILVVDGDLVIDAEVNGDVVVVRGSLTLDEGAEIRGDVKLLQSELYRDGGRVDGRVEELDQSDLQSRLRNEIRSEMRSEYRDEIRRTRGSSEGFSPFSRLSRGIGDLVGDLIAFMVFSAMGLAVVFLAKDRLEIVAETARRAPGRSALVGLAGGFLVLPTYVLGGVALVVSVVGIIALPFWLFLFPILVALSLALGGYSVTHNIGVWVAEQRLNGLDWLRPSNVAYAVIAGVGTLTAFSFIANLMGIVPGLGFVRGIFGTLGSLAVFATLTVGFGAVLITRGGKQREFYDAPVDFEDEWHPSTTAERADAASEPEVVEAEPVVEETAVEEAVVEEASSEPEVKTGPDAPDEEDDEEGESNDA